MSTPAQTTIAVGVPDEGTQLLFYIECPECDTLRGYRVGNTWSAMTNAEARGVMWEVACDVCKRGFRFKLVWATTPLRWTTRAVEVAGTVIAESPGGELRRASA